MPLGTVVRELARDDPRRAPDEFEAEAEALAGLGAEERRRRFTIAWRVGAVAAAAVRPPMVTGGGLAYGNALRRYPVASDERVRIKQNLWPVARDRACAVPHTLRVGHCGM